MNARHCCIHNLYDQKYDQRHNQEIDYCSDEFAVIQCDIARDIPCELVKVHAAEQTENRVDDVIYQRRDDAGKGAADDDTDSHVDTLARLASDDTIIYVKCYREDDSHYLDLQLMEKQLKELRTPAGQPYNLVGLPLPEPCYDPDDGHRLPATYANFLITPHAVLMPVYGQERNDMMARQMLESVFAPAARLLPWTAAR